MKKTILASLAFTAALGASAETPLWLRNVKISPDGENIAFTYQGDIYTVNAAGGKAKRVTTSTAYDTNPIWSPDSKKILFSSDRHGNFDLYIVPAEGGEAVRLTTNSASEIPEAFSTDGKRVYYSAYIQAPTKSVLFPSGRLTQLYSIPVGGGSPRQELGTPVRSISWLPDGKSFLYQDVKGMENEWRKHHTSSVSKDIWKYDATTGKHQNLTDRPGEDRNPILSKDGKTVYFLSERNGASFNVYQAPVGDMKNAKALTNYKTHPIRFLSQADNGLLAFGYDGEIYTMMPGGRPNKVEIDVLVDPLPVKSRTSVSGSYGVPSPDGKQVAYTARGEVFVTSTEHSSTKQITHSPAAEKHVSWNPDNREIVYTSLRDGHFNIYSAKIAREDDPNFSNATIIEEKPIIKVDNVERTMPKYSPDGKKIAFIQDRNKLMVYDVDAKKTRQLTDGSNYTFRDGAYDYQWSPDSKWITLEALGNGHDPYTDIALIDVDNAKFHRIVQSGYTDRNPQFVMDGNAILFLSERYGMRNHASWGSQDDAMLVFLNKDAFDKFKLSKEDYELRKEVDKQRKKNAKKSDSDDKDDKGKDKDSKAEKIGDSSIKVELDGIEERIVRATPYSSDLAAAWVDNDGKNLYYFSAVEQGYDLWKMDLEDKKPAIVSRLDLNGLDLYPSADGKSLFIMGDKMKKFDLSSKSAKNISSSATLEIDHAAEREAMFDQVYISEREMFYDKNLHGVDWDGLTKAYRRFLPHINNNYDFAEMLSEWLGELNVSHTGGYFRSNTANDIVDRTPSLGLLYDMTYDGQGLKVDEIVKGGPFDNANTKLTPGCIIESVNGEKLNANTDLNNLVGKKTLLGVKNPATGETFEEVVIPISASDMADLMYKRWVKSRADYVDKISGGRLGYAHIQSMGDDSFRTVYADLLGKYNNRDGVVIDIRWNGGGRLHEDIEVLLSGDKYFTQVIRGNHSCDMPSRRYNKPSIMVMEEACYSNAHGTPWVYSHQGIGKLVGMPVAGTMTSVNWVRLQDPTMQFGIPVIGYQLPDGSYLENSQLEPDILVRNLPQDAVNGEDAQLRRAVEELLREIDSSK